MASTKVKGVVIGGVNIKEKDRLVSIYTLERGKMSISMRGVRGDKAKLKFAKELFCFGEFLLEEGKSSRVVTAVDVIDDFYGIAKDIDKYFEACAILDVVSKFGEEPNPALFIALIKGLKLLCYENCPKYYVFDKFLIEFFKIMGWNFLSKTCSSCGATLGLRYLNLEIGELVCPACKNSFSVAVSEECFNALRLLDNTDYDKLPSLALVEGAEIQACKLLVKNYEFRTGYKFDSFA